MGCCDLYDGSFLTHRLFESFFSRLSKLIDFDSLTRQDNDWHMITVYEDAPNTSYKILRRADVEQNPDLPYECVPYEKKYQDPEVEINIKNWNSAIEWTNNNVSTWALKATNGTTLKTYSATSGDPYGGKEVFANYANILPQIPVNNNKFLTKVYDNFGERQTSYVSPIGAQFPAHKRKKGLGLESVFQYIGPHKYIRGYDSIDIDWVISERIGEVPFDDIESPYDDVNAHKQSYKRFLRTGKTCGNFIYIPPKFNMKLSQDVFPTQEEFTIPYGLRSPEINNVFYEKNKVASHWDWEYDSAVLCWYRYDPSRVNSATPHVFYVSDGDIFWARNPEPIKCIRNNHIEQLIPANSTFLYVSKNIYSRFLNILRRLEDRFGSSRVLLRIAADLATSPPQDEITLDTMNLDLIVPEIKDMVIQNTLGTYPDITNDTDDIVVNLKAVHNNVYKIQQSIRQNNVSILQADLFGNVGSYKEADITNRFMEQVLSIPFKHDYDHSDLNYAYSNTDFVRILDNKYGSNIKIRNNQTLIFPSTPQFLDPNIYCELDFEVEVVNPISRGFSSQLNCSPITPFGYSQQINIGGQIVKTTVGKSQYNMSCDEDGRREITNVGHSIELSFNDSVVESHTLTTGTSDTAFTDRYYRGSYDLALMIDGERICSSGRICNKQLKEKYYPDVDEVPAYTFKNDDVIFKRIYNVQFINPNINVIGTQNESCYIESNLFNNTTYTNIDNNSSSVSPLAITFNTFNTVIKLYNITVGKLRSNTNPSCKSIPVKDKCKCYPIIQIPGFDYHCNNALSFAGGDAWTPNVSTIDLAINGGRKNLTSDKISYYDYDKDGISVKTKNNKTYLPGLDRYYDPITPYECAKEAYITLPVHTTTKWQLDLQNFLYDTDYGSLWGSVSNNRYIRITDRNQIYAKLGDGTKLYFNKWTEINNPPRSLTLYNSFHENLIGSESILYEYLPCSYERRQESPTIDLATLNLKYLPHKNKLNFKHNRMKPLSGVLSTVNYNPQAPWSKNIVWDDQMFAAKISGNSLSPSRFVGQISPDMLQQISVLNQLDRPHIHLHLINGNESITYKSKSFGYYINKKPYLGWPIFYELANTRRNQQIPEFLPSYYLTEPNLYYKRVLFPNVQFDNKYYNHLKSDRLDFYFAVPHIIDLFQRSFSKLSPDRAGRKGMGYIEYNKNLINTNTNLKLYRSDTNTYYNPTVLLAKEDCYFPILFLQPRPGLRPLIHSTYITKKYLYQNTSDGSVYSTLQLLPLFDKNARFDYQSNLADTSLYFTNNNLHLEIYRSVSTTGINNKWSDVYGYDNFKSFDLFNRLDREYESSNLAYDNLFYQLGLLNSNYIKYYRYIPQTKLSGILIDNQKVSSVNTSLLSTSNVRYDKSLVDYKNPMLNINYFSIPSIRHVEDIFNIDFSSGNPRLNAGVMESNAKIPMSGLFSVDNLYSIDLSKNVPEGYFWVDLEEDNVSSNISNYTNHNVRSQHFKLSEPYYILESNSTEIINSTDESCSTLIRPTTIKYTDSISINNGNTTSVESISYQPLEPTSVYCDIDYVDECDDLGCDIAYRYQYQYKSKYKVGTEKKSFDFPYPGSRFAMTIGDGSYHNYPYIVRSIIKNNRTVRPNLMADDTLINDGHMSLPMEEVGKTKPYGTKEYLFDDNYLLDAFANEILFRIYYGACAEDTLNCDTIGEQTIQQYNRKLRYKSFKSLIESNVAVSPEDIYDLIPYDYNNKANSEYLTYNGGVSIVGIPAIGDSISIQIGTATLNAVITEGKEGIYVTVNGERLLFRQTRFETKGVVALLEDQEILPIPGTTTKLLGQCRIFVPGLWSTVRYFTKAVITVDGEDIDLGGVYRAISPYTFFTENGRWAEIKGNELMRTETAGCVPQIAYSSPRARGIVFDTSSIPVSMQKSYTIIPVGRGTVSPNTCLGTFSIECNQNTYSAPSRAAGIGRSPVLKEGSIEDIGGGILPRDPLPLSPSCYYEFCGPGPCLPGDSTDKTGQNIFTNKKQVFESLSANQGIVACECSPYFYGYCDYFEGNCNECTERDKEIFRYAYEYGAYKLNLRGHKYQERSSSPPKVVTQEPYRRTPALCFDFSPLENKGAEIEAEEVCGLYKSPNIITTYNVYEQTTVTTDDPEFKCPETILNVEFTNNKVIVHAGQESTCFEIDQIVGKCPKFNVRLPNDTYSFDTYIDSSCKSCPPQSNKIKLNNEEQNWETIIEDRIGFLGYIVYNGDINNVLVGTGSTWIWKGECGPIPDPNLCYDQPYSQRGGLGQCGKSAPSSYPWNYCISCKIPGSPDPELITGGNDGLIWTYGGVVTNCFGISFPPQVSPQFPEAKQQYLEDWKKTMEAKYLDVAPCHNNNTIPVSDIIEGVVPNSCGPVIYELVNYPGLAYRRTYNGAESRGFTLGVYVAYFNYKYKRPLTIQDKLGDPKCVYYNIGNQPSPPYTNPNIVEKYINGGVCEDDVICEDKKVEQCDNSNYCCKAGVKRS